jgi:quercetin dioxygenase-like cupin family protein
MATTPLERSDAPERELRGLGLVPSQWSAGPGATFAPHAHHADKRLYVIAGSIDFDGVLLGPGDGILIAAGTTHGAVAGRGGVSCVEAFAE